MRRTPNLFDGACGGKRASRSWVAGRLPASSVTSQRMNTHTRTRTRTHTHTLDTHALDTHAYRHAHESTRTHTRTMGGRRAPP